MSKQVVYADDLHPDGVRIRIAWDLWDVGMSTFVPCIATMRAISQMKVIAFRKGVLMTHDVVIEDGVFGVRFWRKE